MGINKNYMMDICKNHQIEISEKQLEQLDIYSQQLLEWNEKINLTSITLPDEIAVKHFLDSLLVLKAVDIPMGSSMIDVGTGAGFPALPCKIVRPDIKVTLLDSVNKRLNFLRSASEHMEIECEYIHARAEDGAYQKELRESFDYATARAVAHLRILAEYCMPYVKVGGYFIALKGGDVEDEIELAKPAIRKLRGEIVDIKYYNIEEYGKRSIIVIKKTESISPNFPRKPSEISKKPL